MPDVYLDTSVIIRFVTGDDPAKQAASRRLFERADAGELRLVVPLTAVSEAAYVLTSRAVYGLPRSDVAEVLKDLVNRDGLVMERKARVTRALSIFGERNVDFGDALLVSSMEDSGRIFRLFVRSRL
jgi:predicted nucleic acid-binding protein